MELFLKDGKSAGVFYCSKCHIVAGSQHLAEQCCKNYLCSKCGKDVGSRSWLVCETCRSEEEESKERERFNKAVKLTQWDGWIYDGSNYHESIEAMMEVVDDIPEYVWACGENHFVKADISDITERMEDEAWEDWDPETLNGLEDLKNAITRFNEANKDVCSYSPDYTTAILINKSLHPS